MSSPAFDRDNPSATASARILSPSSLRTRAAIRARRSAASSARPRRSSASSVAARNAARAGNASTTRVATRYEPTNRSRIVTGGPLIRKA